MTLFLISAKLPSIKSVVMYIASFGPNISDKIKAKILYFSFASFFLRS